MCLAILTIRKTREYVIKMSLLAGLHKQMMKFKIRSQNRVSFSLPRKPYTIVHRLKPRRNNGNNKNNNNKL